MEEEDDEEEEGTLKWKSDLASRARDAFYSRQSSTASLRKLVYGHLQVSIYLSRIQQKVLTASPTRPCAFVIIPSPFLASKDFLLLK